MSDLVTSDTEVKTALLTILPRNEWAVSIGGNGDDSAHSIQATQDGGCVVVGPTESFSEGDMDILIIKLDSHGNTIWQKSYGGSRNDSAWSIRETLDQNQIGPQFARQPDPGRSGVRQVCAPAHPAISGFDRRGVTGCRAATVVAAHPGRRICLQPG